MESPNHTFFVQQLLDHVKAVMPQLDEPSKAKMQELLTPFDTCIALATWDVDDVRNEFEDIDDDMAMAILNLYAERYDTTPDFDALHDCFEALNT